MSKNNYEDDTIEAKVQIHDLAQNLINNGVNPGEVSYWLAFISADIGLQLAPSAQRAFAVIFDALSDISEAHDNIIQQDKDSSSADEMPDCEPTLH